MAQVVQDAQWRARVDDYLDYLLRKWGAVPQAAAEWEAWGEDSRLTFVLNWGVVEDRLGQVQEWAAQDLLTPEQRARYEELSGLVARHRATVTLLAYEEQRGR